MAPQIHPTALVDESSTVADSATIGPYCIVRGGVDIRADVHLVAHVCATGPLVLEEGVTAYPFSVLGADPEDLKHDGGQTHASIGAGTVIREFAVICRGTTQGGGTTRIGRHCFLMGHSYTAHDSQIGDHVVLSMHAVLAGHVQIHDRARIGSGALVHQFVRVGSGAMIGAGARIVRDVFPYALVHPSDSHIAGVNLVGLRRSQTPLYRIRILQQAYTALARDEPISARLESVHALCQTKDDQSNEVDVLYDFGRNPGSRGFTKVIEKPLRS